MQKAPRHALNRFFQLLRKTRGWEMDWNGSIRRKGRVIASDGLVTVYEFCPITSVCRMVTRKIFSAIDYSYAAKALGLNQKTAQCLVTAADGDPKTPTERRYRAMILKATRLKKRS